MGLLDALSDPAFRSDFGGGLLDAANRGVVGGLLGAPVDAATGVVNAGLMAGGYLGGQMGLLSADQLPQPITNPVGGSEWIGQKLQDGGFVSPNRNALAEALATAALPVAGAKVARALPVIDANSVIDMMNSGPRPGSLDSQIGAIFPAGKARYLADMRARQSSGTYPFGDVTDGQAKQLARYGLTAPSNQVFMTDAAFNKLLAKRVDQQNYTPEEMADFAERAMQPRAGVDLDPAKAFQNPALVNRRQWDPVTKRYYDATMPLAPGDAGFEIRSIFPDGLPPRKK
ncbi:hypothetical protein [Variovorax sp. PBL-E5]|uniref:hypothetical protein n=1 Tax=Variovorax sp. PBL-E5 TaxID=434014 RepID=UPI0013198C00|nr:hypothetical protein [Variovorax sp. PBL-E5]VTU36971.1 hypothetical protein E5CHR_04451 [Variovorax sp. PBL-E5]